MDEVENSDFDINSLTNHDDQYWRIDWFGYLSYEDKTGDRRSTPLISVYLSPLVKHPSKIHAIESINSSHYKSSRKVEVPVTYLILLRLGDIWHKGNIYASPRYKQLTASNVSFLNNQNLETLKVSHRDNRGNFLVPFNFHPYHQHAPGAYCETFTSGDTTFIVPHWVILQAYFSSCSYLFEQQFRFGLALDTLYAPHESFIKDGHAELQLKKQVHDVAAKDVARIAWDFQASKAYKMVSNSLSVANNNNCNITPKTLFPFSSTTNLKMKGKEFPYKGPNQTSRALFVYQILSCTAQYPFESLTFYRDNPGKIDGKSGGTPPKSESEKSWTYKVPRTKEKTELIPAQEPNNQLNKLLLTTPIGTTLLGGNTIKVEKKYRNLSSSENNQPSHLIHEHVDTGNFGGGNNRGNGAPISMSQSQEKDKSTKKDPFIFPSKPCRLNVFRRICNKIAKLKNVNNISFIAVNSHLSNQHGSYSYFPRTFTPTGRDRTWRYLDYIKSSSTDKQKHRRVLIIHITVGSTSLYLLEIERRVVKSENSFGWVELDNMAMLALSSKTKTTLEEQYLKKLLQACAEKSGTWQHRNDVTTIGGFQIKTLKHPGNETLLSPEIHDQRFISNIESTLGVSFD